jgi:predicted dienelactone hydrolase
LDFGFWIFSKIQNPKSKIKNGGSLLTMKHSAALGVFAILFTTMCSSAPKPGAAAPEVAPVAYTSRAGEIPVGVIPAASLSDPQRNRRLELTIEYPTRAGSYPVIVFSTGFGPPSRTYVSLSSYLASHGYVVMKVGHPETRPDVTDLAEVWKGQTAEQWGNRARDLSYVIDSFATLQQQYPEISGKIDVARIGVSGHSYGAFAAMLVAGVQTFANGAPNSYADQRVRAALVMSPQGPGERRGLTNDSWLAVRVPILYMTGSSDRGLDESENETWRRQAFELSPAGDKWFVSIAGAGHYSFAGRLPRVDAPRDETMPSMPVDPRDPRDPRNRGVPEPRSSMQPRRVDTGGFGDRQIMNVVRTVSLAFWDAYLKNEAGGREYLTKLTTRTDMTVASK